MQKNRMYKEQFRLTTFLKYPSQSQKFALVLAHFGFIYTGGGGAKDDAVTCVFCNAVKSSWSSEDDIEVVHRSLSPDCPIVTGRTCENVKIDSTPAKDILDKFKKPSELELPNHSNNNHNGYKLVKDLTVNTSINTDDKIISDSTFCIKPLANKNMTFSELGIVRVKPKLTLYASKPERLLTFSSWPKHHFLKPTELADAGFYYEDIADRVRCFYCGIVLCQWRIGVNVWVKHAELSPRCSYMRQKLGQHFIEIVAALSLNSKKVTFEMVTDKLGTLASVFHLDTLNHPLKNNPAVESVSTLGYHEKTVLQKACDLQIEGKDISKTNLLLLLKDHRYQLSANTDNDNEHIQKYTQENHELCRKTLCKKCYRKDVEVAFLPCGHLICCIDCSSPMMGGPCPSCSRVIERTVRVYIN